MNDSKPPRENNLIKQLRRLVARLKKSLFRSNRARYWEGLPDASPADRRKIEQVTPYTMTSHERRYALIESVRHVIHRQVPGAFVECGVWRGGSVLAAILTLQEMGIRDRDIWLYDTFEGMTQPTEHDTSSFHPPALNVWRQAQQAGRRAWDGFFKEEIFGESQVRDLLYGTGYPRERLHFVRGPVEQTLPGQIPDSIALLRLDTDWYESTRHELLHLYPRLVPGGVMIVDDYGHWQGCRKAVDEYFAELGRNAPLLARIDYTARLAVKPG